MKLYEMIYVTKTDLQYDLMASLKDKIKKVIKTGEGKIVKYEDWGKRKFSYEVAGYLKGHYYLYQMAMPQDQAEKLTRIFNMDDNVLLHQTLALRKLNTAEMDQLPEVGDMSEIAVNREPEAKAESQEKPALVEDKVVEPGETSEAEGLAENSEK
jgi:small subunit ribosomal protein S6